MYLNRLILILLLLIPITASAQFSKEIGSHAIGGVMTGGILGSVLFVNPDGTIDQDNTHFFYDSTAKTLFAGTNSSALRTAYLGASEVSLDVNRSITDGAALQAAYQVGVSSVIELNPDADTNQFDFSTGLSSVVATKAGNTKNFGAVYGGWIDAEHFGNGDLYSLVGMNVTNHTNTGSGTISGFMLGAGVYSYKFGTGNVADNEGIYILTGNAQATGVLTTNEGLWIASPYHDGTITTNTGIKIEEQAVGVTNWTIDASTSTAPSRFGGPVTATKVNASVLVHLTPTASPPGSPVEGDIYTDTSHAICYYDGSAWIKLGGAGTCS